MSKVQVFLSYCWNNSNIADDIYNHFKGNQNIELHRDTIDIGTWSSIKEYMQSIKNMDYTILLISDTYLKSANCMYEVLEVMRDRSYKDKIFPAVIDSGIYNPITRAKYVKHWQDEFRKLESTLKELSIQNLGNLNEDLKRIQDISSNIAEFLDLVSDMNNPNIENVCVRIEIELKQKVLSGNNLSVSMDVQESKYNTKLTNLDINQYNIGVGSLRKDGEKFLEIVLKKREETGKDIICCKLEDFSAIPNISMNINSILDDLKIHGCIGNNSSIYVSGGMTIYLTMEGIEYFRDKERINQGMQMGSNTNNFYGPVSNMQIQQGTINSSQTQTTSSETVDFEKVSEFVAKIKKYDIHFEDEYGEQAIEVREKIDEISSLVQKKENPGKIKSLLIELKNLSVGITGSLIATGIVEGIKHLGM